MNPQGFPYPPTNRREIQLQGPRPTPLRISKDSHKIKKPPIAPKPHPPPHAPQTHAATQPLIIYSVSPKPIYVDASNFMSIVQQLTGRDSDSDPTASQPSAPVSPAARMAVIERTSPRGRRDDRRSVDMGVGMGMGLGMEMGDQYELLEGLDTVVDVGAQHQMPGILSPAPANLPAISPGMFLPAAEGQTLFGLSDFMMSPFMGSSSSFLLPSPSSMFFSAAPVVSPTPSPGGDFFNIFDF